MPRSVISILILVLASCRSVCAADACETAHAARPDASTPDETPHPANDDNCLCNGGLSPESVADGLKSQCGGTTEPNELEASSCAGDAWDEIRLMSFRRAPFDAPVDPTCARQRAHTRALRC